MPAFRAPRGTRDLFAAVRTHLHAVGVEYQLAPHLVRGFVRAELGQRKLGKQPEAAARDDLMLEAPSAPDQEQLKDVFSVQRDLG